MKGRLYVVDSESLLEVINTKLISIRTPRLDGAQWLRTIADIMADMLQIEIGDYVFLWETKCENQKSRIHGVYRAISKPYYQLDTPTDTAPFKIKIEKAYDFENPIEEYELLNNPYIRTPLWTVIGKKIADKPRGTSPLSMEEMKYLIMMLVNKNPDYSFIPFDPERIVPIENPLHLDYSLHSARIAPPGNLNNVNPNTLAFFDEKHLLKCEKALETIFNQEMTAKNATLFNQLGIRVDNVIWYSNYLPYSIEQSEMDYLIIESEDKSTPSKLFLIEFIKDKIDESHIYRSLLYSAWVNQTLTLGQSIAQPIIICPSSPDFINGELRPTRIARMTELNTLIRRTEIELKTKPLIVYTYDFSTGIPVFTKKR